MMPTSAIADYYLFEDRGFTLDIEGDRDKSWVFDMYDNYSRYQRPILAFKINSSRAMNIEYRIVVNENEVIPGREITGDLQYATWEAFGASSLFRHAPNRITFFVEVVDHREASRGEVTFSDIILWFQRDGFRYRD